MICPPSKAISTTTRPSASAMDELREDTIDGVWMEERDLEPEQTPSRLLVDQLDALLGELSDRHADVSHLVGDVMHPRPAFAQELSHRGLLAERRQQLDAALADPQRCRLDSLFGNRLPGLEPGTEKTLVRADGLIEGLDGTPERVDPEGLHGGGATFQGPGERPVSLERDSGSTSASSTSSSSRSSVSRSSSAFAIRSSTARCLRSSR